MRTSSARLEATVSIRSRLAFAARGAPGPKHLFHCCHSSAAALARSALIARPIRSRTKLTGTHLGMQPPVSRAIWFKPCSTQRQIASLSDTSNGRDEVFMAPRSFLRRVHLLLLRSDAEDLGFTRFQADCAQCGAQKSRGLGGVTRRKTPVTEGRVILPAEIRHGRRATATVETSTLFVDPSCQAHGSSSDQHGPAGEPTRPPPHTQTLCVSISNVKSLPKFTAPTPRRQKLVNYSLILCSTFCFCEVLPANRVREEPDDATAMCAALGRATDRLPNAIGASLCRPIRHNSLESIRTATISTMTLVVSATDVRLHGPLWLPFDHKRLGPVVLAARRRNSERFEQERGSQVEHRPCSQYEHSHRGTPSR